MDLNKVFDRSLSIIKNPLAELTKVKGEEIKPSDLITQYIAILAVIPAVATIIGWGFIGVGFFRYSIIAAITAGILTYILSIASVYISGIVINALAPNFASKQSDVQAMKLAAYAATPGLLGGNILHHTYVEHSYSPVLALRALHSLSWYPCAHGNT